MIKGGCIDSPDDPRDYLAENYICMGVRPESYFPAKLAPILDQGRIQSCVAHSIATLKWYQEYQERKSELEYSTNYIYFNREYSEWQGKGLIARQAIDRFVKDGTVLRSFCGGNSEYPNATIMTSVSNLKNNSEIEKIRGKKYIKCSNVDELCEGIFQYNGALVTFNVPSSFNSFYNKSSKNCLVQLPKDDEHIFGSHMVCAIGYDEEGIWIQNSWGKLWGYGGLCKLPYNYPFKEMWLIVDELKDWDIVELMVGDKKALHNGEEIKLDVEPTIVNGRTLVPLRFISELLGADVEYDNATRKIVIRKSK